MADLNQLRECRCGRDGVADDGQCAVRQGWGRLRPGTYCRRDADRHEVEEQRYASVFAEEHAAAAREADDPS